MRYFSLLLILFCSLSLAGEEAFLPAFRYLLRYQKRAPVTYKFTDPNLPYGYRVMTKVTPEIMPEDEWASKLQVKFQITSYLEYKTSPFEDTWGRLGTSYHALIEVIFETNQDGEISYHSPDTGYAAFIRGERIFLQLFELIPPPDDRLTSSKDQDFFPLYLICPPFPFILSNKLYVFSLADNGYSILEIKIEMKKEPLAPAVANE